MKTGRIVFISVCCFILLSPISTCDGQQLLSETTVDYGSGWTRLTSPAIGLRFSLILGNGYWPEEAQFLLDGGGYVWTQPGTIVLGPDTDEDWYDCVESLTNGDQSVYQTYNGIVTQDGPQGGHGYAGRDFFQRDLTNYEIDYITLQVQEMYFDSDGNRSGIATWSVYGNPIPEPATLSLLLIGGVGLARRRKR